MLVSVQVQPLYNVTLMAKRKVKRADLAEKWNVASC